MVKAAVVELSVSKYEVTLPLIVLVI